MRDFLWEGKREDIKDRFVRRETVIRPLRKNVWKITLLTAPAETPIEPWSPPSNPRATTLASPPSLTEPPHPPPSIHSFAIVWVEYLWQLPWWNLIQDACVPLPPFGRVGWLHSESSMSPAIFGWFTSPPI